jgi:hypothetical protein
MNGRPWMSLENIFPRRDPDLLFVSVYALRCLHNKNMNYGQRPRSSHYHAALLQTRNRFIYCSTAK